MDVDLTHMHVVVDANQLGDKGHVNPRSLRFLARALSIEERELWIPEPVLWEWAEHMVSDLLAASSGTRTALRLLAPEAADLMERPQDYLATKVIETLADIPNVLVLSPHGDAWRLGVRDQVLAMGAGRRKSDVKTGAADTVSVHAVHHHETDASKYLVHGADADWMKVYTANGWTPPWFMTDFKSLFMTKPGNVDTTYAQQKMSTHHESLSYALSKIDAGMYLREAGYPEIGTTELQIGVDEILSLENLDEVAESSLFFARLHFEGVTEAVIQSWDPLDEEWSSIATGGYQVTGVVDIAYLDDDNLDADAETRWEILSDPELKDADGHDLKLDW